VTDDGSALHVRQAPRKRSGEEKIADFTMLVRVPGQPAAVRAFTDAERTEADTYAAATGGTVVPLPLPAVVMPTLADSQPGPEGDGGDG
jgi:hypothetical protein